MVLWTSADAEDGLASWTARRGDAALTGGFEVSLDVAVVGVIIANCKGDAKRVVRHQVRKDGLSSRW